MPIGRWIGWCLVESSGLSLPFLVTLGVLGAGLAAFLVMRIRSRLLAVRRKIEAQCRMELERQMADRTHVEDTLRRTLSMFHLLQDVTAAAGIARNLKEAIQSSLDIVCSYTGWPVAHALCPDFPANGAPQLMPTGIWHLECPQDYEAFLRAGEQKSLAIGKGLPG